MTSYGKYEVLERIGKGGFGEVFRAIDTELGRTVAIKTCSSDLPEVRRRFVREGRIAGNLQHPHIVVVHELGFVANDIPYLVQEYIEGRDLREVLASGQQVGMRQKIDWLGATADALRYAHSQGVIHRDVKPGNIRIGTRREVRLLDFGMARLLETATQLTRTGETLGTIAYVPPEMLEGKSATPRCDIFSWGVTAYELITGRKPFRGESISRIMFEVLSATPQAPREIEPRCPSRLSELIMHALEKDPSLRCEDFEAVSTGIRRSRRQFRRDEKAGRLPSPGGTDPLTAATLELPSLDSLLESSQADQEANEPDPALALFGKFRDGLRTD